MCSHNYSSSRTAQTIGVWMPGLETTNSSITKIAPMWNIFKDLELRKNHQEEVKKSCYFSPTIQTFECASMGQIVWWMKQLPAIVLPNPKMTPVCWPCHGMDTTTQYPTKITFSVHCCHRGPNTEQLSRVHTNCWRQGHGALNDPPQLSQPLNNDTRSLVR